MSAIFANLQLLNICPSVRTGMSESILPAHILGSLWRHRIGLFWPVWTVITVLGVALVMWVIPRPDGVGRDPLEIRRATSLRCTVLSVSFLVLFLGCYIAGSLAGDDFTYYDNSLFTLGTLAGHNFPVFIWPDLGRFFPLCFQEYNVLRHFTNSPDGYHAVRVAQLVLLPLVLLLLDWELNIRERVGLILLLLITPSILISFSGLIYAESNIVFLLACLMWSIQRFERTESRMWAVCALISVQLMLYYKETVFLFVLGMAGGRLLYRCWATNRMRWEWNRVREPESRLDLCLALLVIPFLLYYCAAMFPGFSTGYAQKVRLPMIGVFSAYLRVDLLAWILVGVVFARGFLIATRSIRPSLLWEGLALGSVAYMAGYLALRMQSAYYFAPVDFVAVLYLGRLTVVTWTQMKAAVRVFSVIVIVFVVIQDLSLSLFRVYEMKNVIHAKAAMGSVIEARYRTSTQPIRKLFFPFSTPVDMMELGAYLTYRGLPMENDAGTGDVMIVGREVMRDGPCVSGKPLICHRGSVPEHGDIVVVLPDDIPGAGDLISYRSSRSIPLFSYDPYPAIPGWIKPVVAPLHVVSPIIFNQPLPDEYLRASVTVWQ